MSQLVRNFADPFRISLLLLVPLVGLMLSIIFGQGRRGKSNPSSPLALVSEILFGCSIVTILIFTLMPAAGMTTRSLDLVPRRNIWQMATDSVGPAVPFGQLGGNLLLLAPLGFLGPIRWRGLDRWRSVTLLGVGLGAAVETMQYVLSVGRVSSVDDVILATLGALFGYVCLVNLRPRLRILQDRDQNSPAPA